MYSLALADFMSVFYDGILEKLLNLFGIRISGTNSATCAIFTFYSWVTSYASYHITVLFSLDKCIAVWFPFVYRQYGQPKFAVFITILVYVAQCMYAFPAFLVIRLDPGLQLCYPVDFSYVSHEYFVNFQPEVSTILHGFVPVFLVFLFTVLTVVKLMSRSAEISRNNNRSGVSRKEREMTKQMIVVCIIFTIFALIGTGSIRFMFETSVATLRDEALFNVASGVVTVCFALVNSVNFYLYLLFGQKFRSDFTALIRGRKRTSRTTNNNQNWEVFI